MTGEMPFRSAARAGLLRRLMGIGARAADQGAHPRDAARARHDVLGVRLSDPALARAGAGVPQPRARAAVRRRARRPGGDSDRRRQRRGGRVEATLQAAHLHVERLAPRAAAERLRSGKIALLVIPPAAAAAAAGPITYRFDPTRAESLAARDAVDRALQTAAGRRDPRAGEGRAGHRAGHALHRLPDPGPHRHEHHVGIDVGHRLGDREHARAQAAQAADGHADAAARSVARAVPGAPAGASARGRGHRGVRAAGFPRARSPGRCSRWAWSP